MSTRAIYFDHDPGRSNLELERRGSRDTLGIDRSTIIVTPSIAPIPVRVVLSWLALLTPMNQKVVRLFVENMEVGEAYSVAFETILKSPEMASWKYILTLETDNCPPPDGLIRLIEDIESGPYDAVGGLYWTKGEDGRPNCCGKPGERNFIPWVPPPDTVSPCNGLAMGFTLFRLDMFKDPRLPRPFFRTVQEYSEDTGVANRSQDLQFFLDAGDLGYKFACSTRALVGHWDEKEGRMW